jgi:hypothetical protein
MRGRQIISQRQIQVLVYDEEEKVGLNDGRIFDLLLSKVCLNGLSDGLKPDETIIALCESILLPVLQHSCIQILYSMLHPILYYSEVEV